jgi:beta-glucosidase-like glycosyl hydrolase
MIACAKHWAGDGQGTAGKSFLPNWGGVVDRSDIEVDLPTMQKYGMDAYQGAIQAGLGCIMVSDTTWNGSFITSNSQMITDQLKGMYGFKGFVITDWNANVNAGGIDPTINAGVDMLMQPQNWQQDVGAIANSANIPDSRIDDAVTRILNTKCQAGLFNFQRDPSLLGSVGSADHRALGRKAVAQSLVVLQNNNNVLPLSKTSKVWVGGSGADNLANQCGGWTINWQGEGNLTTGTTISQAIGKVNSLAREPLRGDAGRQPDAQHAARRGLHAAQPGEGHREAGRSHRAQRAHPAHHRCATERRRVGRRMATWHRGGRRRRRSLRRREADRKAQPQLAEGRHAGQLHDLLQ